MKVFTYRKNNEEGITGIVIAEDVNDAAEKLCMRMDFCRSYLMQEMYESENNVYQTMCQYRMSVTEADNNKAEQILMWSYLVDKPKWIIHKDINTAYTITKFVEPINDEMVDTYLKLEER